METKELEKDFLTMVEAQKQRPVSGDGTQPVEEFPALSGG